jgi:hypothetical protein
MNHFGADEHKRMNIRDPPRAGTVIQFGVMLRWRLISHGQYNRALLDRGIPAAV